MNEKKVLFKFSISVELPFCLIGKLIVDYGVIFKLAELG